MRSGLSFRGCLAGAPGSGKRGGAAPFAACSRECRYGFRVSSASRSSRAALSPCLPAGRPAGSARTRSRVQTLENPFLGNGGHRPRPPHRRRRQAPARGPAAVHSLYRSIRNETQNARPLLVGRAFVDLEPKATGRPHCGHSRILVTTPEPTVRPPSRIAKRRPSSHAIGVINVISMSMLSPGITISTPSGSLMLPVTSVVRK